MRPRTIGGSGATRWRSGADAGLPRRDRRRLARGLPGGGRGRRRRARERAARARRAKGRRLRDPRLDEARVGAVRLRARRSSAPSAPRSTPTPRRATALRVEHSDAVGVLAEDEAQRAKLEGVEVEHVLTFADLDALRERGPSFAAEHPDALAQAEAAIGEDDLFTFIYTSGTTGPPKACMITHRNYYAMTAGDRLARQLRRRGRHDAALPAARAQLRPADAPRRALRRPHGRVPARPAARSPRRSRPCARRCCRACRACSRRCTRPSSRSSTRRPACGGGSSTGRSASAAA